MSSLEIPFTDVDGLLGLVRELRTVLELVDVELDLIADTPQPMPENLVERLVEHQALVTALKAAPQEWKPRLRQLYREALDDAHDDVDDALPSYPVDELVRERVAETLENVRRQMLLDVTLADALRDTG